MSDFIQAVAPVRRITSADGVHQYFYGYYDNLAFSPDDRLHLCNRVGFMDRLPRPDDVNELGVIDLATGRFDQLATTQAWNFQQGSMLEWHPTNPREVLYNTWDGGSYAGAALDISSGRQRVIGPAIADVSPDGKYGLAVNFSRIYDFRPGYGYCQVRDPWYDVAMPEDDGVFLVDLITGAARLLISYAQMGAIFNTGVDLRQHKIVVNHITFNQSSDRFLFLVRYFPQGDSGWKTALGTSDLQGSVYNLYDYTYASHYYWRDGTRLLIQADCGAGSGLYELTDRTREYTVFDRAFFERDLHCSYSPDRRYIIGDGYPDGEHYRAICLYNIAEQKGTVLGRFYSPPAANIDVRCDLHTRWNHSGTMVSFDSIHEGFRGVYTMELADFLAHY